MWKDLSPQWQIVLEEAWHAFSIGSIPIGAAIFDKNGLLLVKGHNTASEPAVMNPHTAHADLTVLQPLDCRSRITVREVHLHSSMEPCPMCLGAVVMSNVKHLSCGSHDRWCGALHMIDTDPYMRSQRIQISDIPEDTEFFQIVLSSYYELKYIQRSGSTAVLDCFRISSSSAVAAAEKLFLSRTLDLYAQKKSQCKEVYDMIMNIKEE